MKSVIATALVMGVLLGAAQAFPHRALQQSDVGTNGEGMEERLTFGSIADFFPVTRIDRGPATVQRELTGRVQLLDGDLDTDEGVITLPLYRGQVQLEDGSTENIWYILTDSDNRANAEALGINFASKLSNANIGRGSRQGRLEAGGLTFMGGSVDFEPELSVTPGEGPNYFPPTAFQAGSVGDADYSPLVTVENLGGIVYNAPAVAGNVNADDLRPYCTPGDSSRLPDGAYAMVHDKVVSICPSADGRSGTVTLELTPGFASARPVLYLSTDTNTMMTAALEGATLAPGLQFISVGTGDDTFSATEVLFAIANGFTNGDINSAGLEGGPGETVHPSRQGLQSALRGDGFPINVLGGIPTVALDYSPLWDVSVAMWTDYAVENGYRVRLEEEFQILGFAERGFLTSPGGSPLGPSGGIVNCAMVYRFL